MIIYSEIKLVLDKKLFRVDGICMLPIFEQFSIKQVISLINGATGDSIIEAPMLGRLC